MSSRGKGGRRGSCLSKLGSASTWSPYHNGATARDRDSEKYPYLSCKVGAISLGLPWVT